MMFIIEAVIACLFFHIMIVLVSHNREEVFVNDYPDIVTEQLRTMGLIAEKPPAKKKDIIRKILALFVYAVLFALILRYMNGITTFMHATFSAYGLWLIVDWYDFFIVDILCAPFYKFYKLTGVSAFNKEAVLFHFKGSLRGMILGILCALIVGIIVVML